MTAPIRAIDDCEPCIHRTRDCRQVAPGFSKCVCGQLFAFIAGKGVGRYKKVEEITLEDQASFSPEMEAEFLAFMRGG